MSDSSLVFSDISFSLILAFESSAMVKCALLFEIILKKIFQQKTKTRFIL